MTQLFKQLLCGTKILSSLLILVSASCVAQDYQKNYNSWKEAYINDFKTSENSPLKKSELKHLRFYEPDSTWNIAAKFTATPNEQPFQIPTSSGKMKNYIKYGFLYFKIKGQPFVLSVYKMIRPKEAPVGSDYMFVPFKDFTNGETTYGGGRYIEFTPTDFQKAVVYREPLKSQISRRTRN